MKKGIFTGLIALAISLSPAISFSQAFQNGDNILALGVGFGSALGNYTYGSQTPALSLQYEHGMWPVGGPGVISLGGYLGYKSFSYDGTFPYHPLPGYPPGYYAFYTYTQKWSYTVIGIRSAYHFNMINSKDWDLYAGVMLSYDILSYKYSSNYYDPYYDYYANASYDSGLLFSLYIGGRYFVSNKVALFAELGYGIAYFNIGAALKL